MYTLVTASSCKHLLNERLAGTHHSDSDALSEVFLSHTSIPTHLCGSKAQSPFFSLEKQSYCGGSHFVLSFPPSIQKSSRPVNSKHKGDRTASRWCKGAIWLYHCSVHLCFCLNRVSCCVGSLPPEGAGASGHVESAQKVMVTFSKSSAYVAGE